MCHTPNLRHPCYDCGSTIAGHHTPLCNMRHPDDKGDLPQKRDRHSAHPSGFNQHWTGVVPEGLSPTP